MKYELIKTTISQEYPCTKDILDEENNVIGQELDTENYYVTITLGIKPTDEIAPDFSKDIIVVSDNSKTGFEVDVQRDTYIQNFLNLINDGN